MPIDAKNIDDCIDTSAPFYRFLIFEGWTSEMDRSRHELLKFPTTCSLKQIIKKDMSVQSIMKKHGELDKKTRLFWRNNILTMIGEICAILSV